MRQISIPIFTEQQIKTITEKTQKAFKLKAERKELINAVLKEIDKECERFGNQSEKK